MEHNPNTDTALEIFLQIMTVALGWLIELIIGSLSS